jgi:chromosome segregation ATPase
MSTYLEKKGDLRMTGYKYDVTFYLEEDEAEAFDTYRKKKELLAYEGVKAVIRELLVKTPKKETASASNSLLEERVNRLEQSLDNWTTSMFRCTEKSEKAEERVAELQDDVEKIKDLLRSWL